MMTTTTNNIKPTTTTTTIQLEFIVRTTTTTQHQSPLKGEKKRSRCSSTNSHNNDNSIIVMKGTVMLQKTKYNEVVHPSGSSSSTNRELNFEKNLKSRMYAYDSQMDNLFFWVEWGVLYDTNKMK